MVWRQRNVVGRICWLVCQQPRVYQCLGTDHCCHQLLVGNVCIPHNSVECLLRWFYYWFLHPTETWSEWWIKCHTTSLFAIDSLILSCSTVIKCFQLLISRFKICPVIWIHFFRESSATSHSLKSIWERVCIRSDMPFQDLLLLWQGR